MLEEGKERDGDQLTNYHTIFSLSLPYTALMYTVMSGIFKDKNNQEAVFLKPGAPGADLEYVIVRPGQLVSELVS